MTVPGGARLTAPVESSYAEAAAVLAAGGLVAFPTDTVYALAAAATDPAAVARFYEVKRRPADQPAILLAPDLDSLRRWVDFDARAQALAGEHWPGPLTLILRLRLPALEEMPAPQRAAIESIATRGTIGVRVPGHPTAHALLEAWGGPLCSSSANHAGDPPPLSGAEVLERLGDEVDLVIDGECPIGLASSILDLTSDPPRVLREGAIPAARLTP